MKKYIILMLCILFSCGTQTKSTLKFQPFKGIKYHFEIPIGYEEKISSSGNDYCIKYWYEDSAVFYLTTFRNTNNYEFIIDQGTSSDRFNALNSRDTLTLMGVTIKGLHWKDQLFEDGVTAGYSNIPPGRYSEFEQAISTVTKLKKK